MSGLGGLNKSAHGVVVGLVQLQLPVVETPAQLKAQAERICWMVGKARRNAWARWTWWCFLSTRCTACR
jgi:formamidase